jgi:glycosyltransferase involved in cell wall biosynthesis
MMSDTAQPGSSRVILVVPCFNEAARLQPAAFERALAATSALHLLFVDDGSVDGTAEVLAAVAARMPSRAEVLRLSANRGKAEAVRQGVLLAFRRQPGYIGFWDADLATPLEAVPDFLALLDRRAGIDIVLGSRALLLGRDIRRRAGRHYFGRVFATAASLALGLPVYDTQCGAKVFRVNERTTHLFDDPFVARWSFDVELLARYLAAPDGSGASPERLYELALRQWHDIPGSKVRLRDVPRAFGDLVRVHRRRRQLARRLPAHAPSVAGRRP